MATALALLPAPSASAAPPTNLSPSAGDPVPGIPVLAWDRIAGATSYDVQVATTDTFGTPLINQTGTANRQYVPTKQLPPGLLHWRVCVNGAADSWANETFAVDTSAAPTERASFVGGCRPRAPTTGGSGPSWPRGVTTVWSTGHTYEVLGLAPPAGQPVVRTRDAGLPVTVRVTAIKTGFVPARCTATSSWSRKLKTTTTAALEAKKVPKRGHGVLRIHVDVLGLGVPLGKVQVKKGSNVLATVTVKNDSGGDLTIRLKKLAPGKHKLKVFYFGSTATESSKARKLVLTVLKK